jgi:predicted DNA-binding transcriptional regulator YafY
VLTVLELLQSQQRISGPELAARLEVDVRTVRRYIAMLQDLGIPIEAEIGRYGGYMLRPGFKLPPLMFTEDEVLAITLGLLMARRVGLDAAAPAFTGAMAKIERVLPGKLREHVQAMQETLIVDSATPDTTLSGATLLAISTAARLGRRMWLRYRAAHGEERERAFDPYGLVYHAGRWYAVGYCHLRADLRVFRLDRVRGLEICDETFTRPSGFDCLEYMLGSFAAIPDIWTVEVLLQTTIEQARRWVPPALAMLEQSAQGIVFRTMIDDLDYMARFLVGLRCPLVIRQPDELRAALRRLAGEIDRLAAGSETEDERATADLRYVV